MPSQKSYRLMILFLVVALVATSVVALCIGRYSIDPREAFAAVFSYLHKQISATVKSPLPWKTLCSFCGSPGLSVPLSSARP